MGQAPTADDVPGSGVGPLFASPVDAGAGTAPPGPCSEVAGPDCFGGSSEEYCELYGCDINEEAVLAASVAAVPVAVLATEGVAVLSGWLVGGGAEEAGGLAFATGAKAVTIAVATDTIVAGVGAMAAATLLAKVLAGGRPAQVFKEFSSRKQASDARPRPKPHKPKGQRQTSAEKVTTRQGKKDLGTGNHGEKHGPDQTPHFHDDNHGVPGKQNIHYGYPD